MLSNLCLFFFIEVGNYLHPCETDLVVKCTNDMVPYFNAPIFLENKSQIGKVDEIFGPMTDFISFHEKFNYCLFSTVIILFLFEE